MILRMRRSRDPRDVAVPESTPAGDYDEAGVPTFEHVRDKIEGRYATASAAPSWPRRARPAGRSRSSRPTGTPRRGSGWSRSAGRCGASSNDPENERSPAGSRRGSLIIFALNVGGDLLSHTLASAVPSALEGLASGFGMGPGVPPPPTPPTTLFNLSPHQPTGGRTHHPTTTPTTRADTGEHGCVLRVTQWMRTTKVLWASPRPISTGRLHPSQSFHPRPINPIVSRGPYPRKVVGDLILERASRLDAFSGYPFRT